nr:hypothetical protein [Paracoccus saliphilus]
MDYLKRREAEGLDGRRPEFGDLQRAEDAAWAEMGETPLPRTGRGCRWRGLGGSARRGSGRCWRR